VVVAKRNHESERGATMTEDTPIPGPLNNVIRIDDERIRVTWTGSFEGRWRRR
jgi:hypothetical protein